MIKDSKIICISLLSTLKIKKEYHVEIRKLSYSNNNYTLKFLFIAKFSYRFIYTHGQLILAVCGNSSIFTLA